MKIHVELPRGAPGSEESKAYMREYGRLRREAGMPTGGKADESKRRAYHRSAQARRRGDAVTHEHDNRKRRERYATDGTAQRARSAARRAHCQELIDPLIVLELHDGVCGICGEDVDPFDFHVDHRVQIAHEGEHSYENCQPAHPDCNTAKNGRAC